MAQAPTTTHDLTDVIPVLSDSEEVELLRILKNPVVVKYFRGIALTAVFEMAKGDITALTPQGLSPKYLIDMAFQKGILHMADAVISKIPKE